METIYEKLARLRVKAGLSIPKAASLIGVSETTIKKWESGECMPKNSRLARVCQVYHVTEKELR